MSEKFVKKMSYFTSVSLCVLLVKIFLKKDILGFA